MKKFAKFRPKRNRGSISLQMIIDKLASTHAPSIKTAINLVASTPLSATNLCFVNNSQTTQSINSHLNSINSQYNDISKIKTTFDLVILNPLSSNQALSKDDRKNISKIVSISSSSKQVYKQKINLLALKQSALLKKSFKLLNKNNNAFFVYKTETYQTLENEGNVCRFFLEFEKEGLEAVRLENVLGIDLFGGSSKRLLWDRFNVVEFDVVVGEKKKIPVYYCLAGRKIDNGCFYAFFVSKKEEKVKSGFKKDVKQKEMIKHSMRIENKIINQLENNFNIVNDNDNSIIISEFNQSDIKINSIKNKQTKTKKTYSTRKLSISPPSSLPTTTTKTRKISQLEYDSIKFFINKKILNLESKRFHIFVAKVHQSQKTQTKAYLANAKKRQRHNSVSLDDLDDRRKLGSVEKMEVLKVFVVGCELMEVMFDLVEGLENVQSIGLNLGEILIDNNNQNLMSFRPSNELAISDEFRTPYIQTLNLASKKELLNFINGNAVVDTRQLGGENGGVDGWVCVSFESRYLGWGFVFKDRVNSRYIQKRQTNK